jgi:transposase
VRMIPPIYVKAYVKRGNIDAADAEAICEPATRPTMRFVPIKGVEQQAAGMLLRTEICSFGNARSWRTRFERK